MKVKHFFMTNAFKQSIKKNPFQAIALFVTLGNVVAGIVLWAITAQLRPVADQLVNVKAEVEVLRQEIKTNNDDHDRLVSKDTFGVLVTRIDHISNRVDQIYSAILRK